MPGFLEAIGLKWLTLIAGFLGAVISLKFIDGLSVAQRASTVIAGALVAGYCTPLTVELLGLSQKLEGPVAFLGGLFGMSIAGAAIKAIPEWVAAAKEKWLGSGP
jgi:hypothetical protein